MYEANSLLEIMETEEYHDRIKVGHFKAQNYGR